MATRCRNPMEILLIYFCPRKNFANVSWRFKLIPKRWKNQKIQTTVWSLITTNSLPIKTEQADLAAKYRAGNFGYGHAKQAVFEKINALLEEPRERYEDLKKRPDDVQDMLNMGAQRARSVAQATLERVRNKLRVIVHYISNC